MNAKEKSAKIATLDMADSACKWVSLNMSGFSDEDKAKVIGAMLMTFSQLVASKGDEA